ncbi:outer membrane beta-barrel protein [Rufibacter ruber]|uniref:outer membrane beta-barrel protein n=1 Tax=Rufibacter ruber TaxID=1783499 RepID=UPI0009EE3F9F|nr:outer membrane beta-barrel protein [Rufibacter ruber]
MSMWSDGGFALNGISFGATGQGIQRSAGAGGNFNTLLKNGIKLNLQYFYGGINADLNQLVNSQQFLKDRVQQPSDTLNTRRLREQDSRDQSHRIGGKIDWKIDSLTSFSITPSVTFSTSTANQYSLANTTFNFQELANDSQDSLRREGSRTAFTTAVSFERLFKKKGRIFTLFGDYNYNLSDQDQINRSINQFYRENPYTVYLDQLRVNDREGLTTYSNFSFTEPLRKDLSAVLRFNTEYFQDENDINTYRYNEDRGQYDILEESLSDRVNRDGWRNYLTLGLRWKIKDVSLQPGVRATRLDIYNRFERDAPIDQHYFYVYPSLNITWKQLNFSYNVNVREPNAADLQPVPDNTNQLYVQYGNPGLTPTISHSLNLHYRYNNTNRSLNYSTYLYGTISEDAVTRARTVDLEDGKQTSTPLNTGGNWNISSYTNVMKDYKFDGNRQFSVGGGLNIWYSRTLILLDQYRRGVLENQLRGFGHSINVSPRLEGRMNLNDKLEIIQTYSVNRQWGRYEKNLANNIAITNQTAKSEVIVRLPKKLVWEVSYDYWYNSNAAPGLQRSYGRLNAGITYLFMKNDRGQLKLSVFDALDQNLSAYRSVRENMVEDYQTAVLNRYGLLTFTYNIRNFGGKVGGSSNSFFRF